MIEQKTTYHQLSVADLLALPAWSISEQQLVYCLGLPTPHDAYNPSRVMSVPLAHGSQTTMLVRVEPRDDHLGKTETWAYGFDPQRPGQPLRRLTSVPAIGLEDPFTTTIQGEIIVGGVRVNCTATGQLDTFRTEFWCGKTLEALRHFSDGPERMKDIRLVELPSGTIGVFTRPQPRPGTGYIGFVILNSLDDLTPQALDAAPLIHRDLFAPGIWCGVNDAIVLKDDRLLVLAHAAYFDPTNATERHYIAFMFEYTISTNNIDNLGVVARRQQFPAATVKETDLTDVVFPGGFYVDPLHSHLYATFGLSDSAIGWARVHHPQFI